MCFSATASFVSASVTGMAGVAAATQVARFREAPLAAIPFVFSAQQAMEGCVWLALQHRLPVADALPLANGFIVCALVIWPLLVPAAAGLIETGDRRLKSMIAMFAGGVIVAAYAAQDIVRHPYAAQIAGHSLCYVNNSPYPPALFPFYALATCGPLVVSSHRALRWFGWIIVIGLALSLLFYFVAFLSIWCFFAAAASVTVCAYFYGPSAMRLQNSA